MQALSDQARSEARLGEILLARGLISEANLTAALARQWDADIADLSAEPPDATLMAGLGAADCLARGLVPWQRAGGLTLVATSRPERFEIDRRSLEPVLGPVAMVVARASDVQAAVARAGAAELATLAETSVPAAFSCRRRGRIASRRPLGLAALASATGVVMLAPASVFWMLTGIAAIFLTATLALRAAILWAAFRDARHRGEFASARSKPAPVMARLPVISILVPLFREGDIAGRLVRRLEALDYPRELTDILLVTEADDATTAAVLARTELPPWIRVCTVPPGAVRTKPRALNYALSFCRGGIVGIYDAEDAPAEGQLRQIATAFAQRGPDVACLQGMLDYYNPGTNWMSRCFTVEYAAWFRVMLPGLQRLGLPIPLGGTTLFFRRAALEALGGWDAWNVTEDADLGLRLARAGYRTEIVATVTQEEACCRPLPWVRQRSRWIKGYMMTWATHMRRPRSLWRQLGARGFLGMQVLVLGSIVQVLLAPLFWMFWLAPLGLVPPAPGLGEAVTWPLAALFVASEASGVAVAALGLRRRGESGWLMKWVPTLYVYHPLAVLAAWKAAWEVVMRPFYWDKTTHGIFDKRHRPGVTAARRARPEALPLRAAAAP
ncbi:glycosyltransferase [Roseicyclus sp. F158]|uniref:Glycosyltransferase n=1 Tax=Tropicimonas omnivorans TaxID=3075590 RepID=A0ABU3DFY0_9RHOB|nr:glycosyltransferase family 2 protein [Roseicyclus sp. F158]MDT0682627.1 glycosyltransferase [Roseicyclus sp. F158]